MIRRSPQFPRFQTVLWALVCAAATPFPAPAAEQPPTKADVEKLVELLDAPEVADRDAAQKKLLELALADNVVHAESVLTHLPKPNDDMPLEARRRLRQVIAQIGERLAERIVGGTRVTLEADDTPLPVVLELLAKQTGNKLVDVRRQFDQSVEEKKVTASIDDEPFWPALDKILDSVQMSPYPFSEEEELSLVDRPPGELRRYGSAAYSGPFRIEATTVSATRGLRSPTDSVASIVLEFAWEPRMFPLAIEQRYEDLEVVCDDGLAVPAPSPEMETAFYENVTPGSHSTEATIGLQLPSPKASAIKSLKGRVQVLVPGVVAEMKFEDLKGKLPAQQKIGGVTVVLENVSKADAVWEVTMRISFDRLPVDMESNLGWTYHNQSYLLDAKGEKIDHAGFETTSETESEVGFVYLFDVPEDIGKYTWVYRTPTGLVPVPAVYELKDLSLP
jgi:hypothetical protein